MIHRMIWGYIYKSFANEIFRSENKIHSINNQNFAKYLKYEDKRNMCSQNLISYRWFFFSNILTQLFWFHVVFKKSSIWISTFLNFNEKFFIYILFFIFARSTFIYTKPLLYWANNRQLIWYLKCEERFHWKYTFIYHLKKSFICIIFF